MCSVQLLSGAHSKKRPRREHDPLCSVSSLMSAERERESCSLTVNRCGKGGCLRDRRHPSTRSHASAAHQRGRQNQRQFTNIQNSLGNGHLEENMKGPAKTEHHLSKMRTSISFYDKEMLRCDFFFLSFCRSVPLRSECSTPRIMTFIASPPVLFCHTCAKE